MQQQINNMQQDLKEVKAALLGSEYNDVGIIGRIEKIEDRQNKDKRYRWMIAGAAAFASFLVTIWGKI